MITLIGRNPQRYPIACCKGVFAGSKAKVPSHAKTFPEQLLIDIKKKIMR